MESETEYRKRIQEVFDVIEQAFDDVDPDVAEAEQALGAMTLTFSDRSRCILSAQPSVRQLWLALASKGTAYHFNWDASKQQWIDDKGRNIELISFLESYLSEKTGVDVKF
jgi:iron donor protein CyaY